MPVPMSREPSTNRINCVTEHVLHSYAEKLAQLNELRREAAHAEGPAVEKQHAKGRLTARERIERLLDPDSFQELDALARHRTTDFGMAANRPLADAVITGH